MKATISIAEEHKQLRESCAYFLMDDWCLVSAAGSDTLDYLQTQTTNDMLKLEVGDGIDNAVTDRRAKLLANFSVHRDSETSALLLVETAQRDRLIDTLETYHIREKVEFDKDLAWNRLLALQGPKSPVILDALTGQVNNLMKHNDVKTVTLDGQDIGILSKNLTGEDGFVLAYPAAMEDTLIGKLMEAGSEHGLIAIGPETREVLRIEAGIPTYGKDMDDRQILPETGLEHSAVSYHKGCYTGQEVIARIKTYGSPAFALIGLIIEGDTLPPRDTEIKLKNKKVGTLKSAVYSPYLQQNIALGYMQKDYRSPGQTYEVMLHDEPYTIKTALLPFYQTASRTERAEALHKQALEHYKQEDDLDKPIALLREAIALDPKYAPGYEALGVMLSKQKKLDEAISLMKRLAEIDPTEIMAHTNLSIYYMEQGRIEDAENEKAEATALQFEKMVEESQAKKAREKKAGQDRAEQERQLEMFIKVLGIDPIDQVANFGLGSIYFDTGRYEEAVTPLQTVVEHYKDYSAAYLLLGKTLDRLSRKEEAAEVFKKGIAAASKKGDLMPLRDMQNRLNQILHSES
ncbi:CAF17-like 4Fe-4S cluster assembly/insertion protein YgfZ [Nitrospina watsonii]|uniref:Aminomethyltransferase GcvT, fused with Tetratricopeptide repeats (Modular protein) n=1 Tax=Nitrospina watsonii TaxID=1323948 RepID=A0ABN8VYM2_9BACT|nr:tetratricopeptide repeat protein [Nitrospina watsonii]CAI2718859.1 Putative Aminomethyltransferase GcvT, fused with Tetratricopeptide repeats (Modular protein) [Nitrospina watsonii]